MRPQRGTKRADPLLECAHLGIVAITPENLPRDGLGRAVRAAAAGGATAIMLRNPGLDTDALIERGRIVARLAAEIGFLFILNGPPEAALRAGAGAVHLGRRTVGPSRARGLLENKIAVGYSVHALFEDHLDEIAASDYITYSPVFPTSSKPGAKPLGINELVRAVHALPVPVVALGGIGPAEAFRLGKAGCRRLAAVSAVMGQDDPRTGAAALADSLERGATLCRRSGGSR